MAVIQLTQQAGSVLFSLQVVPRAKQNALLGVHDGRLKVAVTAPPDKGKANQAVLKLLAKELSVGLAQMEIVRGAGSRKKVLRLHGIGVVELRRRLGDCLARTIDES